MLVHFKKNIETPIIDLKLMKVVMLISKKEIDLNIV